MTSRGNERVGILNSVLPCRYNHRTAHRHRSFYVLFINIVLLEIVKPRSRAFTAAHSEISPFFIGKIP